LFCGIICTSKLGILWNQHHSQKKTAENIGIRTIFIGNWIAGFRGFKLMELLAALRLEIPGGWINYLVNWWFGAQWFGTRIGCP